MAPDDARWSVASPVGRPTRRGEFTFVESALMWTTLRRRRPGAPPLVLLHGFLGSSRDWEPVLSHLHVDALAVDLPGHGDTALGPAPSLDGWAVALTRMIDATFSEPVTVLGYSLGGRLALRLLENAPDRVSAVALVSASPGLESATDRAARAATDDERAGAIVADFGGFRHSWYAAPLFALHGDALARAARRRADVDPASAATIIAALSSGRAPSSWSVLEEATVPVLCVAGARDSKYVEIANQCAARRVGPTEVVVLPAVGHAVHLDAPQPLAVAVAGWIARVAPS